jgi:chromate reductase, NAD(P)H dehydrogenase (quinone)
MASAGSTIRVLKTVVFMGSAKNVTPPWGGDARLGDRVLKHVKATLESRSVVLGDETITHQVSIVDPLEVFGQDGALSEISAGELLAPVFFLKSLPPKAKALQDLIAEADCYVIVSPEYNHIVPPALASVMGHFGGSCYSSKPSGIVTYSAGPWGGQRAALSIVSMTHELGCLPVSKMVGYPMPGELFEVDGTPKDPSHRMLKQLPEMLRQLEWMAVAMKDMRDRVGKL